MNVSCLQLFSRIACGHFSWDHNKKEVINNKVRYSSRMGQQNGTCLTCEFSSPGRHLSAWVTNWFLRSWTRSTEGLKIGSLRRAEFI